MTTLCTSAAPVVTLWTGAAVEVVLEQRGPYALRREVHALMTHVVASTPAGDVYVRISADDRDACNRARGTLGVGREPGVELGAGQWHLTHHGDLGVEMDVSVPAVAFDAAVEALRGELARRGVRVESVTT